MINLGFSPDFASVFSNDSLHGGQADARALEILLSMKALEGSKKFIGVLRVEPHSIVADKNCGHFSRVVGADLNHSGLAAPGKFQRVTEQIIEDYFEQAGIAINLWQRLDAPLDAAILGTRQIRKRLANDYVELGPLSSQLSSTDLGEIQKIINQMTHVIRAVQDAV